MFSVLYMVLQNKILVGIQKIIPSEESEGISLTLKTTNTNHVDNYITL